MGTRPRQRLAAAAALDSAADQTEFLVALITDNSLGRATFGPDGQVQQVTPAP